MKRYLCLISALVALMLALTSCTLPGVAPSRPMPTPASAAGPPPPPVAAREAPATGSTATAIASLQGTLESVYAQVNPSVVNIQVVQRGQTTPTIPGIPGLPTPRAPQPFRRGVGSGFVWDAEGRIVTNNHVVSGADRVTVTFHDGTVVPATVVGTDPDSDLAVLKVDAATPQLRPVKMANSTQLKVGQLAIAIGNPFGLQGTLTVGFVSGLGRLLPADVRAAGPTYSIPDVIQTDAALNPGNSGGVLLNDAGMVIGVTFAIESQAGTSAGVGFAIPSAIVQKVVPELIKSGRYEHPWIGISGTSLNPDLATAMSLTSNQRGALVVEVIANSPAARAGLRASDKQVAIDGQQARVGGDVVVAFDGQTVKSFDDLVAYLARSASVGQTLTLTVLREGKEVKVQLVLAARPRQ